MSQAADQQANRKRFSFGPVWNQAVKDGKVKDHAKLKAHAIKLKVASASQIAAWKFDTLMAKVAAKLQTGGGDEPDAKPAKTKAKAKPAAKVEQQEEATA